MWNICNHSHDTECDIIGDGDSKVTENCCTFILSFPNVRTDLPELRIQLLVMILWIKYAKKHMVIQHAVPFYELKSIEDWTRFWMKHLCWFYTWSKVMMKNETIELFNFYGTFSLSLSISLSLSVCGRGVGGGWWAKWKANNFVFGYYRFWYLMWSPTLLECANRYITFCIIPINQPFLLRQVSYTAHLIKLARDFAHNTDIILQCSDHITQITILSKKLWEDS